MIVNRLRSLRTALKSDKGFTLVEIILTLTLLVLVLTLVFRFFSISNTLYRKTDDLATQQDQGRLIVEGLRKDIGTALSIRIGNSAQPGLETVDPGYYAVYVQDGKRLVRKDHDSNVTKLYSSYPLTNLIIEYAPGTGTGGLTIVHVTVSVESTVIAETDIFTENTALPAGTVAGNLLMYKPS
jgi:prepilin-type N-terminal cleavage/methylation domain-containing protein